MLLDATERDKVTLEVIFALLAKRGAAIVIFLCAFLIFMPFALFPGFAATLAIIILFAALNLIWGTERVWLPRGFLKLGIPGKVLKRGIEKTMPVLQWLDDHTGKRLVWIAEGRISDQVAGVVIILLAITLILFGFIPFAGGIAFPIMLLATGLFVRDGLVSLIGYVLSIATIIAIVWIGFFAVAVYNGNDWQDLISRAFTW
ncbi:MAG: exopolysaccharide biosynthesis protein [Pseudomonadota bacterium]